MEVEGWEICEGGMFLWRRVLSCGRRQRAMCARLLEDVVNAGVRGSMKKFQQ